ncbi:MAG: hypothetical protein AAB262_11930 [Elusimicrobiota bacterium]
MTRLLDFLWLLPLLGYFGGANPPHGHTSSSDGGLLSAVNLPGSLTAGTPLVKNPLAASTSTTTAHGLAVRPTVLTGELECLTAELNYSIGDIVDVSHWLADTGAAIGNLLMLKDATNLTLIIGAGFAPGFPNKTTFAVGNLTPGFWKLTVTPHKKN